MEEGHLAHKDYVLGWIDGEKKGRNVSTINEALEFVEGRTAEYYKQILDNILVNGFNSFGNQSSDIERFTKSEKTRSLSKNYFTTNNLSNQKK